MSEGVGGSDTTKEQNHGQSSDAERVSRRVSLPNQEVRAVSISARLSLSLFLYSSFSSQRTDSQTGPTPYHLKNRVGLQSRGTKGERVRDGGVIASTAHHHPFQPEREPCRLGRSQHERGRGLHPFRLGARLSKLPQHVIPRLSAQLLQQRGATASISRGRSGDGRRYPVIAPGCTVLPAVFTRHPRSCCECPAFVPSIIRFTSLQSRARAPAFFGGPPPRRACV